MFDFCLQMTILKIQAAKTTIQYAKMLGESLRNYSQLVDVRFVVGEGTSSEELICIEGSKMELQLTTIELVYFLPPTNANLLTKVSINLIKS